MSRWKIKNVVLVLLAITCYIIGVRKYYELRENYQSVSVRLQGEATTKEEVKTLVEEEKEKYGMEEDNEKELNERSNTVKKVPEITAYEEEEYMQVADTRYGKTKNVTKYLVYGDMNQILPVQICRGNYTYEDDYEGCILDKETAYELFGSLDIIGQQISIDEKVIATKTEENDGSSQGEQVTTVKQREYYIRGILDTSHPIVMVHTRSDKTQFHNLQFNYGNSSRGREYVEQLMMIYPIGSSPAIVDQNLMVRLIGNILFLPWLIAGIIITWKTVRITIEYFKKKEFNKKLPQFLIKKITYSILAVIGIVITAKRFAFLPLQYIPTKWSDFNSVTRTINLIQDHVEEFNYMAPTIREVLLRESMTKLVMAVTGMLILIWVVIERVHVNTLGKND